MVIAEARVTCNNSDMSTATRTRKPAEKKKSHAKKTQPKSAVAQRVQKHREGLRAKGLKPVTLWVPDTSDPAFIAECRRQSENLRNSPHEKELLDWMDELVNSGGLAL